AQYLIIFSVLGTQKSLGIEYLLLPRQSVYLLNFLPANFANPSFFISSDSFNTDLCCTSLCFFSFLRRSVNSFASILTAYSPAFAALFTPTVTTGEPLGISDIDSSESRPPKAETLKRSEFLSL